MLRLVLLALASIGFVNPAHADCVGDLKSVLTMSHSSGPYVVELVSDQMIVTAEIVPPTDVHATVSGHGTVQEVTVIGGKGWMKVDGNWASVSDALAAQMAGDIGQAVRTLDQVGTTQCLGQQSFEGSDYTTFKYEVTAAGAASSATTYVDPATNLPAFMLVTEQTAGGAHDTRASYRYDASITISPPVL